MDRGGCWLITVYRAATNWAIKLRSGGVAGRPSHFQTSILVYLKVSETNDLWQNQAFYIQRAGIHTRSHRKRISLTNNTFYTDFPLHTRINDNELGKIGLLIPWMAILFFNSVKLLIFVPIFIFVFGEDDGQRAVCHRWPEARPDAGWPLQTPYQTCHQPLLHFIASSSPSMSLSSLGHSHSFWPARHRVDRRALRQ